MASHIHCVGCNAFVPDENGPTHRYLESAPGCWRIYGEILAREYGDSAYRTVHRLSVDAYAVQHPGRPSAQTIGSAALHLARLCMTVERKFPLERANDVAVAFSARGKSALHWLEPPPHRGDVTVLDVAAANDAEEHNAVVWKWAASAWNAWATHHATIRAWLDNGGTQW
jgi:hypothetical protein